MKRFHEFCESNSVFNPFPLTEKILCGFASVLASKGLATQTIKTYLSAVRSMQISLGFPDPRDQSSLPILKRVQAGIQRVQAQKTSKETRVRLPITPHILDRLRQHWDATDNPHRVLLWAAASMCFFGFFRSGEILIPAGSSYGEAVHLSWGDASVDSAESPTVVRVHLKRSKCDQFGKGADIYLGRTGNSLCPVTAVAAYMVARGTEPGPFFSANGKPFTKPRFVTEVRKALQALGLPQEQFAGHSFRIGAATAAARAGLEDSTIRSLGRWNSAAFLVYVRTPREKLASLSAVLGGTTGTLG